MRQCQRWLKMADKRQTSYTGLVKDHNNQWCTEFTQTTSKYKEMLQLAINELQEVLDTIPVPTQQRVEIHKEKRRKKKKVQKIDLKEEVKLNEKALESIDVTYDSQKEKLKKLDVKDEGVKDRWSRYIGAMGLDAVKK